MAEALTVPSDVVRYDSDLVDDAFADTLANSLLLHHAVHEEPLKKESFEYVMKGCAEASGKAAVLNPGRGTATWDLRIDGAGWSLKTEAAKGISAGIVKIEKLMEARWIREITNPAKAAAAVRHHVPAHMTGYDRILVLRAFRLPGSGMRYDLVEPPVSLILEKVAQVGASDFTKEGSKESYGADIADADGTRIFRILLDSSVEKVRISFNVACCQMHGSWTVKTADIQQLTGIRTTG